MGRIAIALVLLAAFALLAHGSTPQLQSASSLIVTGKIDPDGTDHITVLVTLPQGHSPQLSLNFSGQMQNVVVYDQNGNTIDATVINDNGNTEITMQAPNGYARIGMFTDYLTSKAGVRWTYNSTYSINSPLDNFEGSVELPPGAIVRSTNGITVNNGGTTTVNWHYSSIDPGIPINRYVNYQLEDTADYSALYTAGAALAASLVILYALLMFRGRKEKEIHIIHMQPRKKPASDGKKGSLEGNPTFSAMEETDKEIIRELHAQGGKATQAHIYRRTQISKSSLSRHLISLENRGLVKRSRKGITTLISLTDSLM